MSRISKEKRNHLILVGVATLAVVAGLWSTLIRSQQDNLRVLKGKIAENERKREQIRQTIQNSQQIEKDLAVTLRKLEIQEEDMASGDLYLSMHDTIRKFKPAYKVEIPEIKSTGQAIDSDLLPNFPYKQVTVTISGSAFYFDLGRFVADFENRFPTSRVLNLDLSPASTMEPQSREKLTFKMEIVSLVKSSGTVPTGKP